MDRRTRENPERTFDLVLKVKCHASENEDPVVLWKFPEDFGDQEVLQSVPKFCFPFDVERVSQNQVGQHFAFVLTDVEGKQRFGFCRLTSGGRVCVCILSYLPWFEVYYKLLNTLADYLAKELDSELNATLTALYNHPVPEAHTPVSLTVNQETFIASEQALKDPPTLVPHSYFIAPDVAGLPTIPESRNLTEYFVAVDANSMLQLYASMLHERRVIVTCSKLSTFEELGHKHRVCILLIAHYPVHTGSGVVLVVLAKSTDYTHAVDRPKLTACLHGSVALLYPMYWQHVYIPVLPAHLLDYCCAPMPYLIGVHSSLIERVKNKSLEDVVMLNVDTNTLESPFNDLNNLPSDVVSALKNKLKKQSTATGDGVARAFLRAQAALFGSYRDALRYKPGEPITFCEESFVRHRSGPMKQFLETAVNLQLFKQTKEFERTARNTNRTFTFRTFIARREALIVCSKDAGVVSYTSVRDGVKRMNLYVVIIYFIEGRLAKLNAGRGFSDVFEEEITSGGFCGGNSRSYQQWVHTVKKGGAFLNSAVTRATPAVRTAYKFAKSHAKQGLKEVRSKLKHKDTEEDCGSCTGSVQYTPVCPTLCDGSGAPDKCQPSQARSHRPPRSLDGAEHEDGDGDDVERASRGSSEDGDDASADFYESDDSVETRVRAPYPGGLDLLGEILDTLSTHSTEQGKLAGARSLDFFRSMDDLDCQATKRPSAPSEGSLALLRGGSGDQAAWRGGQDDSALRGRHLPPSPRRRGSPSGLRDDRGGRRRSTDAERGPAGVGAPPPEDPDAEPRDALGPPSLARRPSSSVPWEKERGGAGGPDDDRPLRGGVSVCHVTSAFQRDLHVSGEGTGGDQA